MSIDDNMLDQMDPDEDGFNITIEEAEKLNKNMNMLHFIRKSILIQNLKLFNKGISDLEQATLKIENFPKDWKCATNDL